MKQNTSTLQQRTRQKIKQVFQSLDYRALAPIYCDHGGEAFWQDRRGPCERIGVNLAKTLKERLKPGGRSLYVGAGVAEIPPIMMEIEDLRREVSAHNLRQKEVTLLNEAYQNLSFRFQATDAQFVSGSFDHIWLVSVLNDPERFPELSALSYGRANPVLFNPAEFIQERASVQAITMKCLSKLTIPGLVTTSVEEIPWIAYWCEQQKIPYVIGKKDYPTAIVGDPICFIKVG